MQIQPHDYNKEVIFIQQMATELDPIHLLSEKCMGTYKKDTVFHKRRCHIHCFCFGLLLKQLCVLRCYIKQLFSFMSS